jgi:ABC-type branched-subunit amino acid transport system permease subunit
MISNKTVRISRKKRLSYFAPVILIFLFLVAVPIFMDTPMISLITKILCFGLLAMSVDIAFGYTGLWTFGHAAIFGVAAYTCAIFLKQTDVTSFWIIAPIGIVMAAIVSAIFAAVAAQSSGLYFLLITFALGQLVYSVAVQWKSVTHGNDGLWSIPWSSLSSALYYYIGSRNRLSDIAWWAFEKMKSALEPWVIIPGSGKLSPLLLVAYSPG